MGKKEITKVKHLKKENSELRKKIKKAEDQLKMIKEKIALLS